mmetsp:Transcript_39401/g.121609  ORF Transcript_39401/g.121609 Transcript_39401/m.121609 type:complete len:338 (-) Transcript_39401:452-1465(-)
MQQTVPTNCMIAPLAAASLLRVSPLTPSAYETSTSLSEIRSSSKPSRSEVRSGKRPVQKPFCLNSTAQSTSISAPFRARSAPKMRSFTEPWCCGVPCWPCSPAKSMSTPHSSSWRLRASRRVPLMKPTMRPGTSTTVTSVRASRFSTCTGPSRVCRSQVVYSRARCRSSGVPDSTARLPRYCTMQPEADMIFLRVPPFFPSAYGMTSSLISSVAVPQSPSPSLPSYDSLCLRIFSEKWRGIFSSTTFITVSCAPRRPRRGPNMASVSYRHASPTPVTASTNFPEYSAKSMTTPHSSSTLRKCEPLAPVTKATAMSGTRTMQQSSSKSSSVTCTGRDI